MTHEFKKLIQGYLNAQQLGLVCVTATVVALEGSSYRRPGVRMLINEHGQMTGAVSGGCVEKEILKQSDSVFKTGRPKMISYDGRYKLGCEGVLYILIEKFTPKPEMIEAFGQNLKARKEFAIETLFQKRHGESDNWGSRMVLSQKQFYSFNGADLAPPTITDSTNNEKLFAQYLKPCFKLLIIGAEHDAAQLSLTASHLGWEVAVVTSPSNPAVLSDFPGASELIKKSAEQLDIDTIDKQMAIVLMTHSYVKDLQYLASFMDARPAYIGLLGPSNRRERILNDLIEQQPMVDDALFELVFGPAGINIGAETPEEIAMSICSEILSVVRKQEPKSLKDKSGSIHHNIRF